MQAVLYKCVAPARVAWRCAPELSKRFANLKLGSLVGWLVNWLVDWLISLLVD